MTKLHFVSISLASSELPHGQLSFSTVLSYRKQFNSYLYPVLLQKVASWLISRRFLRGWKQDIIAKSRTLDPPTFVIDHSSILIIELENPDVFDCVHVSKTCNASSREKFLECKICDLYSIQKVGSWSRDVFFEGGRRISSYWISNMRHRLFQHSY